MSHHTSSKSDALRLGILVGLCLLIGVQQIRKIAVVNADGVFYISHAQRLPGDYAEVARTYPIGYPFVLWAAHKAAMVFAEHDSAMLWLHSSQGVTLVCRMLALIPLYFLGRRLVGAKNSFWALLILLVLPYPARYGAEILREWPHVLFLSLGFWLLCWGLHERRWWVFALVGLDAGLGYLIRPECIQLVLYALVGLASVSLGAKRMHPSRLFAAASGLVVGLLASCAPHVLATGTLMPSQFQPRPLRAPPVIRAIGPKAASEDPLEFEVAEGELLELPIRAIDPNGDPMTFTLVSVPVGSRPVYQFWSMVMGDHFWTLRADEKDYLVSKYPPGAWDYEGIACYAYAQADAHAGLHAVHRFWSSARHQHFYTMDEREKATILQESPAGTWMYEGIAFYAFGEGNRPGDTVPVYRRSGPESRYFWEVGDTGRRTGAVAWYVHGARESPAGAGIENGVFRWRPGSGQKGDYQINVIVSNKGLQSCQLVRIKVVGAAATQGRGADRVLLCAAQSTGLEKPPEAVNRIFAGVAEDLMVVFFVPWLLGLGWRLRHPAEPTERALIVAVVIVNVALMFWRHLGLGSGDDRRYSLGMIALTIFYVPVGVEVMARWLSKVSLSLRPRWMSSGLQQSLWFHSLVMVGILVCLPKLLMASPGNKTGYRAVAEWLRQNTQAEDVLAVPDIRISFYAQRQGLPYLQYPNVRRVDYVVTMDDKGEGQIPEGWRREYSVAVDRRSGKILVIYSTGRPK